MSTRLPFCPQSFLLLLLLILRDGGRKRRRWWWCDEGELPADLKDLVRCELSGKNETLELNRCRR